MFSKTDPFIRSQPTQLAQTVDETTDLVLEIISRQLSQPDLENLVVAQIVETLLVLLVCG